jgi:hypothetical protein
MTITQGKPRGCVMIVECRSAEPASPRRIKHGETGSTPAIFKEGSSRRSRTSYWKGPGSIAGESAGPFGLVGQVGVAGRSLGKFGRLSRTSNRSA